MKTESDQTSTVSDKSDHPSNFKVQRQRLATLIGRLLAREWLKIHEEQNAQQTERQIDSTLV